MMNFEANSFNYDPQRLSDIERTLVDDGYVRLQFSDEHLPISDDFPHNMERFFIELIEKLGGECLAHNEDKNSYVWHVTPMQSNGSPEKHSLARSQTDEEFSFHTDCSYEINPPEYMALFVLEQDQLGGGQLEIIQLSDVLKSLSEQTKAKLRTENFRINIPLEFRKSPDVDYINAPILFGDERIRYRSDILSEQNNHELNSAIIRAEKYRPSLQKYTMIILNNQRYLHGRTKVLDHRRHLLRIRFNRPLPYDVHSVYEREKLLLEYLSFTNEFYDYFEDQHQSLHKILRLIIKNYDQPNSLGEEIRQTFHFDEKIDGILKELNIHRPDYHLGSYRPDILFSHGDQFKINGKYSFQPKICEINARFPFNGYFLSAALCSTDRRNRYAKKSSVLVETMIKSSKFDVEKPMFVLKSKEHGYDIHLFEAYWRKKSSQPCLVIEPARLNIVDGKLIDRTTNILVEQAVLELHQEEILGLSDDILRFFITNKQFYYLNDLRTIFILHDKRLFSLLSNQPFLQALLNTSPETFLQLIPKTYIIGKLPNYLRDSMARNKQHWCIKPNSSGKGKNVTIGVDVTADQWSSQLLDLNHQEWIVQEYFDYVQYNSMNMCGMLLCFNDLCFNLGIVRMASRKIVNISRGGHYIRPYVHQQSIHSTSDGSILTKDQLHQQLVEFKGRDSQWNRSVYISSSGGSGGKHLFFCTDIEENLLQRRMLVRLMLAENVIAASDICLNLFQSGNVYRALEIFNDFCSMANCTSIPMADKTTDEELLAVIEYFRPNVLMGTPYRLMQLAFFLEKKGRTDVQVEKIFFACEALDEVKKEYFRRIFHCAVHLGFYGSAETGVYACQSPKYSSTKIYLYPKDLVQVEIVDSKIIVTNLIRKRNQLIRFDSGDRGRILASDGNDRYGVLEVFGSQRLIMIGADVLSKADIEETMKQIDLIEWQLIIDYVAPTTTDQVLFLFRYVRAETKSDEELQRTLREYLQKFFDEQLTNLADKLILQFEAIQFQQLVRNTTSNKLLKIIDRRQ